MLEAGKLIPPSTFSVPHVNNPGLHWPFLGEITEHMLNRRQPSTMPGPTVRKQNLRQQKATRRSERLAGKRQLVPPGGDDLQRDSEMQDEVRKLGNTDTDTLAINLPSNAVPLLILPAVKQPPYSNSGLVH
jgi:hypothetical protein